jgi:hypothetical protein
MSPTDTLVVWGNGGFAATSKGHDSAPNKKLRKQLSHFMPIVTGTEYNTSKLTCCCHVKATKLMTKDYEGRETVLRCDAPDDKQKACRKLLGRDENAAHNILYIFQHQYANHGEVPRAFRPNFNEASVIN